MELLLIKLAAANLQNDVVRVRRIRLSVRIRRQYLLVAFDHGARLSVGDGFFGLFRALLTKRCLDRKSVV